MRYIFLLILLSGCLSQKKLAQKCADRFPIQEHIKEIIIIDTIQSAGDTILVHFKDSSLPVICPPNKIITKTKEVRITAENTAKTYLVKQDYQKQIDQLYADCDKQIKILNAESKKHLKEIDQLNDKLDSVKKFKQRFYILLLLILLYFAGRIVLRKYLSIL